MRAASATAVPRHPSGHLLPSPLPALLSCPVACPCTAPPPAPLCRTGFGVADIKTSTNALRSVTQVSSLVRPAAVSLRGPPRVWGLAPALLTAPTRPAGGVCGERGHVGPAVRGGARGQRGTGGRGRPGTARAGGVSVPCTPPPCGCVWDVTLLPCAAAAGAQAGGRRQRDTAPDSSPARVDRGHHQGRTGARRDASVPRVACGHRQVRLRCVGPRGGVSVGVLGACGAGWSRQSVGWL